MAKDINLKSLYRNYKYRAKKNNVNFTLTLEEFRDITSKNCYLCDNPPGNSHLKGTNTKEPPYLYNGIDQIEPGQGYTLDNSAPCCWTCNRMKWTISELQLMEHISKVLFFFLKNKARGKWS